MMMIRLVMVEPKIDSSISAKIRLGIAIRTSTNRLRAWSSQRRLIAATRPRPPPMRNDKGGGQRDAHGVAGAVDQPGEHVAADLIGSEDELLAPGSEGNRMDLRLAIGRDDISKNGHEDVKRDDDHAEPCAGRG
jgi:hypothetical protein